MLNAYVNEFSLHTQWNNNDRLHTWLVQTKFNMGTLDLGNHHQSFWQLIYRSIWHITRLSTANHCKVINVQKWSGFLAHPVYRLTYFNIFPSTNFSLGSCLMSSAAVSASVLFCGPETSCLRSNTHHNTVDSVLWNNQVSFTCVRSRTFDSKFSKFSSMYYRVVDVRFLWNFVHARPICM